MAHSAGAVRLAIELLEQILTTGLATETLLTRQFWSQSGLGSRERTLAGDLIHGVLRHRRRYDPDLTTPVSHLVASALQDRHGWTPEQILDLWGTAIPFLPPPDPNLSPAICHSLPDWLWQNLAQSLGLEDAESLAAALNLPAPVDVRVNLRHGSREACQASLQNEGITATPTPFSPVGLRLPHRLPLGELTAYRQGWIEVQDEGSQLIALLVAPQPGQLVVDLCAGGGGKSLHLAVLMQDRGRIVAADADAKRLAGLRPRQRRAGLRSIQSLVIRHEGDPKLRPLTGKADRVLLDVPCSGTGTLRRHPELKWHLTPDQVTTLTLRQSALLHAGARLVRPGGRLVYATCSLLEQENQHVITCFLRENSGFHLLDARSILTAAGVPEMEHMQPFLSLWPHRQGTDGFFAAIMVRG
ncbi:MAG: RsmB/NOP family class I SAM-dependent RNA methyltransferase [Magnetococcus sp. DMHC-1]|nr:RsmB/NOP family class I SAM-dependent RNA methyltransferase [Magnetococcales bacterium]